MFVFCSKLKKNQLKLHCTRGWVFTTFCLTSKAMRLFFKTETARADKKNTFAFFLKAHMIGVPGSAFWYKSTTELNGKIASICHSDAWF